ncbi:hypothetical protein ACFFK0_02900 [Paenibacillus chartarius]|uniref:Citrate transporter-like domain-containing protein n=1 Tax=Paenibacillus chartarius TaxID=747481 RepID=A0ABV6DFI7_9BACL
MKTAVMAHAERIMILLLAGIYIAGQLTHGTWVTPVLGSMVFIAIVLLLPRLRGMTLWLTAGFLVLGAWLMLVQKADACTWFQAAGMNVTLVTLFVFAPLFGIPVRLPAYVEALKRFYETTLKSRTLLFAGTQLLTQVMGVFINVGAIPVVHPIAFVKPQSPLMSRLLAGAMNRGFAGAIFWSPYFAAMALVTSALSLRWSELLPYLLGLAGISFAVSLAVDFKGLLQAEREEQKENADEGTEVNMAREPERGAAGSAVTMVSAPPGVAGAAEPVRSEPEAVPAASRPKAGFPAGLAVYLASAIAAVLAAELLLALPMVLVTCFTAVLFPLAWCLFKGYAATYREGLTNHLNVTLPALKKEITLFLAAGFFSGAIGTTGFGASIPPLLSAVPLPIAFTFSAAVVVLITATSVIGLHPIVTVTILAASVDPAQVDISLTYFAVLLLGSWGISNTISPASAVNNLLAGLFKQPVFDFAVPNYRFAAGMAVVLLLYLAVAVR